MQFNQAMRQEKILTTLLHKKFVHTAELSKVFNVSEVTVRNDLSELEEEGRLVRVHGGAKSADNPIVGFSERSSKNVAAKRAIAQEAAKFIRNDMVIFLDSGTTAYALASLLPAADNLRVVTVGIEIALRLMDVQGLTVNLIGGEVDGTISATVSHNSDVVSQLPAPHLAFLGAGAVDADRDILEGTYAYAESKRRVGLRASRRILIADSEKWQPPFAGYKALNINEFDTVITDNGISKDVREGVLSTGADLKIAQ